ncbi:hypothetical protein [Streptomyces shenzhenensis]|uniref:hypothetical protein n=1 Tax=Streptomyces shenzhenensis TaxID=943815 RepID=UPI001F49228C|nr:hypothetical protein [Streptomyces shenzhenensis]
MIVLNSPISDYRMLVRLEPTQLSEALWRLSPPLSHGRRARWILVLLDIAITDSYPVNEEPDVDLTMRIGFASRLLDFIERELQIPDWSRIADEYVGFARKAKEAGLRDIPLNLKVDSVVGRISGCFSFTRQQAVQVADARRERYLEALTADLEEEEFNRAVQVDGVAELLTIINLLSLSRWFQGKVVDVDLAEELDAWLDVHPDLELGDAVARLLAERRRKIQGRH